MQAFLNDDKSNFKLPPILLSKPVCPPFQAHLNFTKAKQELERYIQDFQNGGMNGPLSYYRNFKSRFEDEKGRCSVPLQSLN